LQVFFRNERMDFNGLRLEYALEGTSSFVSWKDHMEAVLDEWFARIHKLKYFITT